MTQRAGSIAPRGFARGSVVVLVAVALGVVATTRWWLRPHPDTWPRPMPQFAPSPVRSLFERDLDALNESLDRLAETLPGDPPRAAAPALEATRLAYKRAECLITTLAPPFAALMDGPVPEDEDRPPPPLSASAGLEVLEAAIQGGLSRPSPDSVRNTLGAMRRNLESLRRAAPYLHVESAVLLDAFRLELARVVTLGLAGFDTDNPDHAAPETAAALDGMTSLAESASDQADPDLTIAWAALDSSLVRAAGYLRAHANFETLDRLTFIIDYANPASRAVAAVRRRLPDAEPSLRRLWRERAATVFDSNAFDASAYAPSFSPPASEALVELGRRLFSEPALSGPGTRSCATCHNPAHAFTDGRARPALLAQAVAPRHTPTLLDAGFEPTLFDDGRVGSLEAQAQTVLASPTEMGGSEEIAARRLAQDSSYERAFAGVFGPDHLTGRAVRVALAAYVRGLGGLHSRFDEAVRGNPTALSATEQRGFTVFMGKARCATCHFVPLFNGTMPPDFATAEPEIIGVPADRTSPPRLDPDPGRAGYDGVPWHRAAFRVPTLRNVALTAPYMHNGVFQTLAQVVDFYDRGGGTGLGLAVPGQTLPARRLHLTSAERGDLLAFLRALTDTNAESTPLAGRTSN